MHLLVIIVWILWDRKLSVNELLFLLSMREFCSYRFILLWIFLTIALFCPDYSARARVRYFLTSNFFFADVSYLMFCMFLNEFCRCVAAVGDDCELKRGMSRGQ
jgi:hypothetical protein